MKKGGGSRKGSAFERDICSKFSKWWTEDERDDVFWRTSGSGARNTTRAKTGKSTFGQAGDMQASDPIGQPFIDQVCVEIKRGYNKITVSDILDAGLLSAGFAKFILQVNHDAINSNRSYWMIITKRDRREVLIHISVHMYRKLAQSSGIAIPGKYCKHYASQGYLDMVSMRLDTFFEWANPIAFKEK